MENDPEFRAKLRELRRTAAAAQLTRTGGEEVLEDIQDEVVEIVDDDEGKMFCSCSMDIDNL